MQIEIEFRGISIETNEFVFGSYTIRHRRHGILKEAPEHLGYHFQVIPETLGQYTGLKDKNGVKVFSGDIFSIESKIFFVEYIYDCCKYVLTTGKGYDTRNCMDLNCDAIFWSYIIGNVHQNKELLS